MTDAIENAIVFIAYCLAFGSASLVLSLFMWFVIEVIDRALSGREGDLE